MVEPNQQPPLPNYNNPNLMGAFYPSAAFTDPTGDKPTTKIIRYDRYEFWRDLLLSACLGTAILNGIWVSYIHGYTGLYWTVRNVYYIILVCAGFRVVLGCLGTLEFLKYDFKKPHTTREMSQWLVFTLGGIIANLIFYVLWK